MTTRSNPPWSDKLLYKYWNRLEARLGSKFMPVEVTEDKSIPTLQRTLREAKHFLSATNDPNVASIYANTIAETEAQLTRLKKRKTKLGYREYGCGHYGCVMPTSTPDVVMKITTDPTEAHFIAAYLSNKGLRQSAGIIRYHAIIAIAEESFKRRPVFVILRDEARYVGAGEIAKYIDDRYKNNPNEQKYRRQCRDRVLYLMGECKGAAAQARQMIRGKKNASALIVEAMRHMNGMDWQLQSPKYLRGRC